MAAATGNWFCNTAPRNVVKKLTVSYRAYEEPPRLLSAAQKPPLTCRYLFFNYRTKTGRLKVHHVTSVQEDDHRHHHHHAEDEEELPRTTLIWRAVKLPMYSVALIPLTVGSAAAYLQTGLFYAKRYTLLMLSSFLVVAWANLSNDVFDFDTGADQNKKESIVNIFGSRTGTYSIAFLLLTLSAIGLIMVALEARSPYSVLMACYGVISGYIYQCPPFRLSYLGLGEPLVFAAFGPFATTAFYLLQSNTRGLPSVSSALVSSSILVGLSSSLILFCSHFHQVEDDKAVGKFSPLVRFGTEAGSKVVKVAVATLYSLVLILGLSQALPFSCIVFCGSTLPLAKFVITFVEKNHKDKSKIFMAKYHCVRLHTMFGLALAAGLVAARFFASKQLPIPIAFLPVLIFFSSQLPGVIRNIRPH